MQKQFILTLMHGIEYNCCTKSFIENWPKNAQRNLHYELRNGYMPRDTKESLKNEPVFNFLTLWNALDTMSCQTYVTFKFTLVYHLFREISNETNEPMGTEEYPQESCKKQETFKVIVKVMTINLLGENSVRYSHKIALT
jgi:hypothetical protein